jgi:serine protease Do
MSRRFTFVTVALTATVAFLIGLMIAGGLAPAPAVVSTAPRVVTRPPGLPRPASVPAAGTAVSFADVAERINPAVVNIDATAHVGGWREPQRYQRRPDGQLDGPGGRDLDAPRQGSGSGFIIDRDGYILTNHHVIENADRIAVTLADGRVFRAEVVGVDPAIDVALIRVSDGRDLPWAPLGNSDELRVGEWVCAIGNPLGYVHSVTVGVVSFIGRKLFDASLDAYIQTDAAINFGNSGGPLINARGEVIGINSAISSRASNIGFAVPINQAVASLPQLKTRGKVSRGYMGVMLTDVTPALQRALELGVSRGAVVQDVKGGSPAERAGLRKYDVILSVEGRDIATNEELIREVSGRQPGTVARLDVLRDARRFSVPVKLAERPVGDDSAADDLEPFGGGMRRPPIRPPATPLGLTVRALDRAFAMRLDLPDDVAGVVVSRVDAASPAFSAAMRRGFVILEINRKPVRSVSDYERLIAAARPGDVLALYYYDPSQRQRALATVTVE